MGHANRHRRPTAAGRRLGLAGGAVALSVVPFATTLSAPASAVAASPAADGGKTAVIGPLLDFFGFGATIGAPVFCGTLTATLGSGFQEFGAVEQGNSAVEGIDQGCALFSEQGGAFVEQGKTAQAPYAEQFNPVANPVIDQVGDAVTDFGTTYDPALAPFGPTIAGSGTTIKFLAGSEPGGS
jgi:hypothetical protein